MWSQHLSLAVSQVCGSFSARAGVQAHVKMHHAHTNVIGLGDSSTWKMPFLPRSVYLFIAPLAVPIITPLVAVGENNCSFKHLKSSDWQWFWGFIQYSSVLIISKTSSIFSHSWFERVCFRSAEGSVSAPDRAHRRVCVCGVSLSVLPAQVCVRAVVRLCSDGHASVSSHVLRDLHTRQHISGEI